VKYVNFEHMCQSMRIHYLNEVPADIELPIFQKWDSVTTFRTIACEGYLVSHL